MVQKSLDETQILFDSFMMRRKNMRKVIFIVTLIFTLSIMATSIFAEESSRYEDKAQQLNELGLFAGSDFLSLVRL